MINATVLTAVRGWIKMYKSPIDELINDVVTEEENAVVRAVVKCGINVDKDELVKALAYDRGQYEKGYADAKAELITEREVYLISKVFQNYYCMGIYEIAEEDETAKSLFQKIGLIEK